MADHCLRPRNTMVQRGVSSVVKQEKIAVKRRRSEITDEENDYLVKRRKNLEMRDRMLAELGFSKNIEILRSKIQSVVEKEKKPQPPPKKKESPKNLQPERRSSRLSGKQAVCYGEEMLGKMAVEEKVSEFKVQTRREFFKGPEPMVPVDADDETKDLKLSLNELVPYLKTPATSSQNIEASLDSYKKHLKQLKLSPEKVRKVGAPQYSLAVHPMESKIFIITGDDRGQVGFWDTSRSDDNAVELYRPHKATVFCTSVCEYNSSHVYCTAIDGVTRRCDLERLEFEDIYVGKEECGHSPYHSQLSAQVLMIAHGNGCVALADIREPQKSDTRLLSCHHQSVRTVQRHPVQEHIIVTSSRLNSVAVWDVRKVKQQQPLVELPHNKGLKSAFFSPGGGLLLTTCNDNRLRLYETGSLSGPMPVVMNTYHNNQTGRYLRPFKAVWHPQRDDVFIIGSMEKPRKVDIYGIHGLLIHELRSPNLQTILSNCVFHPTLSVVVGHNNSGRVHVFEA